MEALTVNEVTRNDFVPTGSFRENNRLEYMLMRDIAFELGKRGSGILVIVPAGFVVDGFSLPGLLDQWQPEDSIYFASSTLHDWLYEVGRIDRGTADRVLWNAMKAQGIKNRHRLAAFFGVRSMGWRGYGKVSPWNTKLVEEVRQGGMKNWRETRAERYADARSRINKIRELFNMKPMEFAA